MKKDFRLIISCMLLGIIAEVTLLREVIGISYSLFIASFYSLFYFQYRKGPINHKQIGSFLFFCILILTFTFMIYSNSIFYRLNLIIILSLVIIQTVLLTSSREMKWYTRSFVEILSRKLKQFFHLLRIFAKLSGRKLKRDVTKETYQTGKKIFIGLLISTPLLLVLITLLSSADENFANVLTKFPNMMMDIHTDLIWRTVLILTLSMIFYTYMKIVGKRTILRPSVAMKMTPNWDSVIASTVLIFINLLYALFIAVQFNYFFSGSLQNGLSYAEYARRGFFELLVVTVINYVVLMITIKFVKLDRFKIVKILLTILIAGSGVLLLSAFVRLTLYEQVYGFTYLRVFAHAMMIYLFVIFIFTSLKVWAERLPLPRFYLMFSLVFYVSMNIFGVDQFIVQKNMERYEETGKLDVDYLGSLSYSAIPPLVELYEKKPNVYGLEGMLLEKKRKLNEEKDAWQSFNFSREMAKDALQRIK